MIISMVAIGSIFLAIVGWGSILPVKTRYGVSALHTVLIYIVTGTSICIVQLQLLHLFRPIERWVLPYLLLGGALICLGKRKHLKNLGRDTGLPALAAFSVVLFCAYLASPRISIAAYDSQWYHLPAIQWFNREAAIQGFANFQHRFAFNNTNFLLISLFSAWSDRLYQVINGMWLAVLILYGLYGLGQYTPSAVREERIAAGYRGLSLIYVPFLTGMTNSNSYLNTAPELMVGVITALSIDLLVFSNTEPQAALALGVLGILLAASVKVSAILILPIVIGCMLLRKREINFRPGNGKVQLLLAVGLAGLWFFRSWWFSGYLVFPAPLSLVGDPAHQVPRSETQAAADYIYNFARHTYRINGSDVYLPGSSLGSWIRQRGNIYWMLNLLGAGSLLALTWRKASRFQLRFMLPAVFIGIAITVAFLTAPDYRFCWYYFYILNGLLLAQWLETGESGSSAPGKTRLSQTLRFVTRPPLVLALSGLAIGLIVPLGLHIVQRLDLFTPQQLVKLERFPNIYARPAIVLYPEETVPVINAEDRDTIAIATKSLDGAAAGAPMEAIIQQKPLCGVIKAFCLPSRETARSIVIFVDHRGHVKKVESVQR